METMVRETLMKTIVNVSAMTPEQVDEQVNKRLAKRRAFLESVDPRFVKLTDIQVVKISDLETSGYVVKQVVGNGFGELVDEQFAVGMFKPMVYNEFTGRTGKRLIMIYPDGSITEAFGGAKHVVKHF